MRVRARKAAMGGGGLPALTWEPNAVTYVAQNIFQVAGRNATSDYWPGVVCNVGGLLSGVVYSAFSGSNTTVYLNDAICYSGMGAVGRIPVSYGANLCTGGTPITSGTDSGDTVDYGPQKAFDGNLNTFFAGNGSSGLWLGYHFASAVSIRRVSLLQGSLYPQGGSNISLAGSAIITSANLQYSDNGSTWTTSASLSIQPYDGWQHFLVAPPAAPHAYWCLLATSGSYDGYSPWTVTEMQMGS